MPHAAKVVARGAVGVPGNDCGEARQGQDAPPSPGGSVTVPCAENTCKSKAVAPEGGIARVRDWTDMPMRGVVALVTT